MRNRPQIERALAFIQAHLSERLTVARVARAVSISEFHLHRVFHDEVGESVGRFITRKRLELAAMRLASETSTPATAIALDVGYSSLANFSKAFRLYFGISPTQMRNPDDAPPDALAKLIRQYGHAFRPADLFAVPAANHQARRLEAEAWQRKVRFEQTQAMTLTCLAVAGGYQLDKLERTWRELIDRARQLGICGDDVDAWGVPQDNPELTAPDHQRYHACVHGRGDIRLPAPLFARTVPAGRFAVFPYEGPVTGVADAYKRIFTCWFPLSSVVPADYVPLDAYIGNEPVDGNVVMELWLRVRPR